MCKIILNNMKIDTAYVRASLSLSKRLKVVKGTGADTSQDQMRDENKWAVGFHGWVWLLDKKYICRSDAGVPADA